MEMSQLNITQHLNSWELKAISEVHRHMDLAGVSNSGRILHYGCGNGYAIMDLPNAVGYEADARKAQYGISNGANIFWEKEKLQDSFDIVFCDEKALNDSGLNAILPQLGQFMHRNSLLILALSPKEALWEISKSKLEKEIKPILNESNYRLIDITEQYVTDYRQMLIFYRIFGKSFYHKILNLLGRLKGKKRWIVRAVQQS